MHMFEVLRDVEGCPATVLSAQRSFIRRLDVLDMGTPGKAGSKGEPLSIFLFSDSMEVSVCTVYSVQCICTAHSLVVTGCQETCCLQLHPTKLLAQGIQTC